jgi:hypothetical protein
MYLNSRKLTKVAQFNLYFLCIYINNLILFIPQLKLYKNIYIFRKN